MTKTFLRTLTVSLALCPLFAKAADEDLLQPEGGKPAATQPAPRKLTAKISPDAQKVLDDTKTAYAKLSALKLAGTITFDSDVAGKPEKLNDTFTATFAAPNKFRHEVKGNMIAGSTGEKAYVLSLDDNAYVQKDAPKDCCGGEPWPKVVWDVLTMQNPSLAMTLSSDGAATQLVDGATSLTLLSAHDLSADDVEKGTEVTKIPDVKVGDETYTALKLTNAGGEFTFLISPKTHLLRRLTVDQRKLLEKIGQPDVKRALLTFDYTTVEPGGTLDDKQFAWTPPASARELTATATAQGGSDDAAALALVGKPAPDFKLASLNGAPVSLSQQKGSVVVLDFWATWCGPCVASLPELNKFYEDHKAAGVKVFAISTDDDKTAVKPFVQEQKLSLPILLDDNDHATSQKFGVNGIPQTVVIGKDGIVRKVFVGFGPESPARLAQAVDEAMKQ